MRKWPPPPQKKEDTKSIKKKQTKIDLLLGDHHFGFHANLQRPFLVSYLLHIDGFHRSGRVVAELFLPREAAGSLVMNGKSKEYIRRKGGA